MPLPVRSLRLTATRSSRGYDLDAATYIRSVENADGQTLEPAVKAAINAFVLGCKADGIWTAIKASCVLMGARTLSGALTPLVGTAPTNNNFVSGDYDRKTGLVGNGSTKYLNANRDNTADPQNSKHVSIYRSNAGTSASVRGYIAAAIGVIPVAPTQITNLSGQHNVRVNDAAASVSGEITSTGFWGAARADSSTVVRRSGGTDTSVAVTSVSPAAGTFHVFARATASSPFVDGYADARMAFYSIGESLTLSLLDTRVSALYTAISAAIP